MTTSFETRLEASPLSGRFSPKRLSVLLRAGVIALLLQACAHAPDGVVYGSVSCGQIDRKIDFDNRIETLNILSEGFYLGCYEQIIAHGTRARETYRDKTFSLSKETGNIFLPEGILIDYVMESHERGFLTFLLAASFYKTGRPEAARVELRRLDDEMKAGIYNYGEDPVNIILQGVMWEQLDEIGEARVDWRNLLEQYPSSESIASFASERIRSIDEGGEIGKDWKIVAIGTFPEITWNLKFVDSDSGYFSVKAARKFTADCSSETGIRISTESWMRKIAMRHEKGYHPLINVRSWIRLPIGMVYGITTFSSGAAIMVGGCALDVYANGNGSLCQVSIQGGAVLVEKSPKVIRHTLKPDFRRWENVPESLLFTTMDDPEEEPCLRGLPHGTRYRLIFS